MIIPVIMAVIFGLSAGFFGKKWYVWAFLGAGLSMHLGYISLSLVNYFFNEFVGSGPGWRTPETNMWIVIVGTAISILITLVICAGIIRSWRTDSSEIECPSCGSKKFGMQLSFIAVFFITISFLWLYYAYDTSSPKQARTGNLILSCVLFFVGFGLMLGNKKAICLNCRHKYLVKDSNQLYVCCPKCKRNLDGASESMIGDIGICPKCKTEFEIKSSHSKETQKEPSI